MNPEIPSSVHFDLGVDELASTAEVREMHDPWVATDADLAEPRSPQGISLPADDLEPWASELELPGMDSPKP